MAKDLLPDKTTQPAEWYTRVIQLADLADYGPVKGTMIIKPYGYAIWERVQAAMDPMIKQMGVGNAYFPLFIPMSYLEREKSHVEGFAPELAVVTHGGGEKLEESLAVRPTSETIMYAAFSNWIQSWRDLPLAINQWCNVVRWEKRTLPFLRTSEFLWQEGHTAHQTHEEAIQMQQGAMGMYATIYHDFFALDGYIGQKSTSERFAGADDTLTFEMMMPSGKALQSCTSHDLGQNFAKTFDIKFQAPDRTEAYVWQTSWGLSTRSIGGLIMAHGDANGLVLPPQLAPIEIVIVPVQPDENILEYGRKLEIQLADAGRRVFFDTRDDERFGYKLNKWEVKGVPVIIKLGAKEVEEQKATLKRRDTGGEKVASQAELNGHIEALLQDIQRSLLAKSQALRNENTREAANYDDFKAILKEHKGFVKVFWNDNPEAEAKIKAATKATSRCKVASGQQGTDFFTGEPATDVWLFAQSY
ncbi:MAG TPA: proline--tRNA ligase [Patescibacteria group bacterium]|nr:proline--tRNA ligase [Patescibacteria group bacterium]